MSIRLIRTLITSRAGSPPFLIFAFPLLLVGYGTAALAAPRLPAEKLNAIYVESNHPNPPLTDEVLTALLENLGIDPSDPLASQIRTALLSKEGGEVEGELESEDTGSEESEPKVVKFLRVRQGYEFASPTSSATATSNVGSEPSDAAVQAWASAPLPSPFRGEAKISAAIEKSLTPPPLERCLSSDTKVFAQSEVGRFMPRSDKRTMFDVLFVKPSAMESENSLLAADLHEIFGVDTVVYPYQSVAYDAWSLEATRYGASCLPFRIRVTTKNFYFYSGEDALKNFDRDPEGRGVIHPQVQRNMSRFY